MKDSRTRGAIEAFETGTKPTPKPRKEYIILKSERQRHTQEINYLASIARLYAEIRCQMSSFVSSTARLRDG